MPERQTRQNLHSDEHSNGNSNRPPAPAAPLTVEQQIAILEKAQEALEKENKCWWRTLPLVKQRMPKVELHAHLSGSLNLETIIQLLKYQKSNYEQVRANYEDLVLHKPGFQVFDQFPLVHKLLNRPEAIFIAMRGMIKSFADEACIYLEVRTTPKATEYMTETQYIMACVTAIELSKQEFPQIKVFLIVSFDNSWTLLYASQILKKVGAIQFGENTPQSPGTNVIVGIDICGHPKNKASHLLPIAKMARKFHGLGVTVHLGEILENVDDAEKFLEFGVDRIGHGTFLHTKPDYVRLICEKNIPIEVCLTSNLACGTVEPMWNTHAKFWSNRYIPISINTDDRGIFPKCSLTGEYHNYMRIRKFGTNQIIALNRRAMRHSFANLLKVTDLHRLMIRVNMCYAFGFQNPQNPKTKKVMTWARDWVRKHFPEEAAAQDAETALVE